jgi:hypothetical protein
MDDNIEKLITTIVDAHFEAVNKKIDTLQKTLDWAISQVNDQGTSISNLNVNMGKLLAVNEGTRDDIHDNQKKIINRVDEHLEPVTEMVATQVQESVKHELSKRSILEKVQEKIDREVK